MGRAPCCDKANVKKGPWSPEEDAKLKDYIEKNGTGGNWIALPQKIGLKRCGKSCRLRWLNYLRPNIRHGGFTEEEDNIICSLYIKIGSRWSIIAAHLPGRTDNDIKNYWNTKLKSKILGKQRKQHRPRPRKNSKQHEGNSDTQNLISLVNPEIVTNQTPHNYLPQLPGATLVVPPAACLDQGFDYYANSGSNSHGAAAIDILIQELEGTRFYEDPSHKSSISTGVQYPMDATLMQEYGITARNASLSTMMQAVPVSSQVFMNSTVVTSNCNNQIISSTWPAYMNYQQVPNMFPGLEHEVFNENLQTCLGEVDNNNDNGNRVMESNWLYYGSTSGNSCSSTDGESNISWEDMNSSFVNNYYPSVLGDSSENCRGGFARGCISEDQSRISLGT